MLRVLGAAFGIAVVASIITHGNRVVILVAFFGTLALIVWPLLTGDTALRCPYCRKRVKLGAAACHHCGRAISTRPTQAPEASGPPTPAGEADSTVAALKELAGLRDSGALTEDEFVAQKARILGG